MEMNRKTREIRAAETVEVTAAQWRAQPKSTWPSWWADVVRPDPSDLNPYGALLLENLSVVVVRHDDWLVRHASGYVTRMTDGEFRRKYTEIP